MDKVNPPAALEALCGKTYTFRGKEIKSTNGALMAAARAGVPIEKSNESPTLCASVILWGMCEERQRVLAALQNPEKILPLAFEFVECLTEEEYAEGIAIAFKAIKSFSESLTRYSSNADAREDGGNSGNVKTAVAASS